MLFKRVDVCCTDRFLPKFVPPTDAWKRNAFLILCCIYVSSAWLYVLWYGCHGSPGKKCFKTE